MPQLKMTTPWHCLDLPIRGGTHPFDPNNLHDVLALTVVRAWNTRRPELRFCVSGLFGPFSHGIIVERLLPTLMQPWKHVGDDSFLEEWTNICSMYLHETDNTIRISSNHKFHNSHRPFYQIDLNAPDSLIKLARAFARAERKQYLTKVSDKAWINLLEAKPPV